MFVSDNAKELTGAASRLGWVPDPSVAAVQHVDIRQGEKRKMAGCFTLLNRITRLKAVYIQRRPEKGESPNSGRMKD